MSIPFSESVRLHYSSSPDVSLADTRRRPPRNHLWKSSITTRSNFRQATRSSSLRIRRRRTGQEEGQVEWCRQRKGYRRLDSSRHFVEKGKTDFWSTRGGPGVSDRVREVLNSVIVLHRRLYYHISLFFRRSFVGEIRCHRHACRHDL